MYISLQKSNQKDKKYQATFYNNKGVVVKKTNFGHSSYDDFTIHKNEDRKKRYLHRFNKLIKKNELDPTKAITLSTMLLWNKPSLNDSLKDYLERFNLKYVFDTNDIQ
jgi:hypothetical protein